MRDPRPPISAKDRAYAFIKQQILTGAGPSGEFLTEDGVASELGISRTPVREAFLRLDAEELLTLVPNKGAFVRPTTEREVQDVLEVRKLVEVFAARRILSAEQEGARQRVVAQLTALHEDQQELAQRDDAAGFIDRDREFHLQIVSATGNQVLVDLYRRLRDQQLRMGLQAVVSDAARFQEVLREHRAIIDALSDANTDEVETALSVHLETTSRVLRAAMGTVS
jgi:DNA-binding GntR family transcriptional regulator